MSGLVLLIPANKHVQGEILQMLAQALGNQVDMQFAAAEAVKIAVLPCGRQSMAVKDIERLPAECSTNGLRRHLRHLQDEDVRAIPRSEERRVGKECRSRRSAEH